MIVGLLGLLSLPATGVWAAATAARRQSGAPTTLKWLSVSLAIVGLATLVFPPVGLVFGLVSLGWWLALGVSLRRPAWAAFTPARA